MCNPPPPPPPPTIACFTLYIPIRPLLVRQNDFALVYNNIHVHYVYTTRDYANAKIIKINVGMYSAKIWEQEFETPLG